MDQVTEVQVEEEKVVKPMREVMRDHLLYALEVNNYNRTHTAKQLKIGVRTLQRHISSMLEAGMMVPRNPVAAYRRDIPVKESNKLEDAEYRPRDLPESTYPIKMDDHT